MTAHVDIEVTNCYLRRECGFCGSVTGKDAVLAMFDGCGQTLDRVVCDGCIEAGPDGIGDRIRDYADELERSVADLREIAEDAFEMPTPQALVDARTLNDLDAVSPFDFAPGGGPTA